MQIAQPQLGATDGNGAAQRQDLERELARTRARLSRLSSEHRTLTSTLEELETENASLRNRLEQLESGLRTTRGELEVVSARHERLSRVQEDLVDSLSWRLTLPLRWGIAQVRTIRGNRK